MSARWGLFAALHCCIEQADRIKNAWINYKYSLFIAASSDFQSRGGLTDEGGSDLFDHRVR